MLALGLASAAQLRPQTPLTPTTIPPSESKAPHRNIVSSNGSWISGNDGIARIAIVEIGKQSSGRRIEQNEQGHGCQESLAVLVGLAIVPSPISIIGDPEIATHELIDKLGDWRTSTHVQMPKSMSVLSRLMHTATDC